MVLKIRFCISSSAFDTLMNKPSNVLQPPVRNKQPRTISRPPLRHHGHPSLPHGEGVYLTATGKEMKNMDFGQTNSGRLLYCGELLMVIGVEGHF
jgi:hypothetical protein